MVSLDKLAYTSTIRMKNPNEKSFFSLSFLLLCIFCNHWLVSSFVFVLMIYCTIGVANIPYKIYLKLLLFPFLFTLFGVVGVIFSRWGFATHLEKEALLFSLNLFMKAFASTSCLYFLILSTPMVDVIYSLSSCRLPNLFLELMMLMYRYIFVLFEFSYIVFISQDSRLGYSSYKKSFYSLGKLVSSLFLSSYHRASESFAAMESRLYQGEIRVLRMSYKSNPKNYYKTLLLLGCFIIFYYYLNSYWGK